MSLLSARDLKVHFPIRKGVLFERQIGAVKAVDGVDLDIERGTTFGLVGESGCGKSTLGGRLLRLERADRGSVTFDGVDVAGAQARCAAQRLRRACRWSSRTRWRASTPGRTSSRSSPSRCGPRHRRRRRRARREVRELLDARRSAASALPGTRTSSPAASASASASLGRSRSSRELIIADEPVSALDVSIQAQVVNLLEELQEQLGLTYLVIAHDLAVVRHISDTVGVMYLGGDRRAGAGDALYDDPLHPYTTR